jgi:hypothetical protein
VDPERLPIAASPIDRRDMGIVSAWKKTFGTTKKPATQGRFLMVIIDSSD